MIALAKIPTKRRNYFSPTGSNKFPLVGNAPARGFSAAAGANSSSPEASEGLIKREPTGGRFLNQIVAAEYTYSTRERRILI